MLKAVSLLRYCIVTIYTSILCICPTRICTLQALCSDILNNYCKQVLQKSYTDPLRTIFVSETHYILPIPVPPA